MKINFLKIKLENIEGKPFKVREGNKDIYKSLADLIYIHATDNLELVKIAMEINAGKEVDLRDSEVKTIKRIINGVSIEQGGLFAFVRKAILDYIAKAEQKEEKRKVPSTSKVRKRSRRK